MNEQPHHTTAAFFFLLAHTHTHTRTHIDARAATDQSHQHRRTVRCDTHSHWTVKRWFECVRECCDGMWQGRTTPAHRAEEEERWEKQHVPTKPVSRLCVYVCVLAWVYWWVTGVFVFPFFFGYSPELPFSSTAATERFWCFQPACT